MLPSEKLNIFFKIDFPLICRRKWVSLQRQNFKSLQNEKKSITNGLGNADYIEEKFTTKDDFRFGFYISRNKKGEEEAKWFINLNTNLSGASYAFDSPEQIKALFENAISAIANYSN